MEVPQNAINITMFWTWMDDDGIVRTKVKPGSKVEVDHAKENVDAVTSLFRDKQFPLLIDSRQIHSMTREAREYFSIGNRETKINSMAVMVKSPLSRVLGNFFLGINKPSVATRLFDNEEDAIQWLKGHL